MSHGNLLEIKYPQSSCFFNPVVFLIQTLSLSCEEVGNLITEISKNLLLGNFQEVEKYKFITKTLKGNHLRRHIPKDVKKRVLSIGKCLFCGSIKQLTVDHIIPISKGGTHEEHNLQCLCRPCNRKKGPERG